MTDYFGNTTYPFFAVVYHKILEYYTIYSIYFLYNIRNNSTITSYIHTYISYAIAAYREVNSNPISKKCKAESSDRDRFLCHSIWEIYWQCTYFSKWWRNQPIGPQARAYNFFSPLGPFNMTFTNDEPTNYFRIRPSQQVKTLVTPLKSTRNFNDPTSFST